MKCGDIKNTSEGRRFINVELIPRMLKRFKEGDKVLFVGTDMGGWDYKTLFFNPSCLMEFVTMDIAEKFNPDIVGDISNCPQIEDNSIDFLPLIGVYEFVNDKPAMFKEINRILKPDGIAMLSLPGAGFYDSPNNHVEPWECFEEVKPLIIDEMHIIGERNGLRPTSVHCIVHKNQV